MPSLDGYVLRRAAAMVHRRLCHGNAKPAQRLVPNVLDVEKPQVAVAIKLPGRPLVRSVGRRTA